MENLYRLYYIQLFKRKLQPFNFKGKWRVLKILNKLTPKMRDNIVVKTKYGFKLLISPLYDKGIERAIFNKGAYEEGTLWCFNKILKKGDVFVDVGANIGLTTIHASKLVGEKGQIFSFEPMPTTFDILGVNIKLNNLKNIKAINSALSDFEGESELFDNLHINRGAASMISDKNEKGINIAVSTLDNFISKYNILNLDFIKIDVEGVEYPMLLGSLKLLKNENKPVICLEYSTDVKSNYNPELIFDLLKETYGYRIFKQMGGKESLTPLLEIKGKVDLPQHDNIYCFSYFHFKFLPKDLFNEL